MRLIDADELKHRMETVEMFGLKGLMKVARGMVIMSPTVDAVEVVRCKDCKHYWKNKPSDDVPVCLASPKDDAFCSEGERREDETN